MDIVNQYS